LQAARERGIRLGRPRQISPELVERIQSLHRSVGTFAEVARVLNREGCRPPRGKQWYPDSIRRVVGFETAA
jgi:DNA invertase Pin-like site-specific DNA recombinase